MLQKITSNNPENGEDWNHHQQKQIMFRKPYH